MLTDSQIIELSQAELESLDKIELNKPMYPESFTTAESKTHINSIICCAQEKGKVSRNSQKYLPCGEKFWTDLIQFLLLIFRRHL